MARLGGPVERSSGAASPPSAAPGDPNALAILDVHIESSSGVSVVALAGELDLSTIRRMVGPLLEQVTQRPAVLVDLSKLEFIDSSGIGVLVQAYRSANGTPMSLVIGADSQVERTFAIAGLSVALPVFTDRGRALAELAERLGNGGRSAGD
jgi:anti-sigma B factor antagonist